MAWNLHPFRLNWSFRVGRIFGIDIKVHLVFLLLMVLFCLYPILWDQGSMEQCLFQLFLFLLLLSFVLFHELGHSLAAQKHGIIVMDIILWPLGGVARLKGAPQNPYQELIIAAMGPLASLLLAVITLPFWVLYQTVILDFALYANLCIGLINLVPVFPLDGGRILRAILNLRLSFLQATEISVSIGKILVISSVIGALYFDAQPGYVAIICLFLWWAGASELREARAKAMREKLLQESVNEPDLEPHEKQFIELINKIREGKK